MCLVFAILFELIPCFLQPKLHYKLSQDIFHTVLLIFSGKFILEVIHFYFSCHKNTQTGGKHAIILLQFINSNSTQNNLKTAFHWFYQSMVYLPTG